MVGPSPPPVSVNVKPCNLSNIIQLDGNNSISHLESESDNSVIISPHPCPDKIEAALHLPTVATYNMRSLFPKIGNVKTDLLERGISVGFFSEIWEKSENKSHKFEIEKMMESEGLRYISTARPKGWGGAAIIANEEKFYLEKLNISIPHNLEVIWGLLKSKSANAKFKKIILCSYHSPPRSKKNQKLTDHLVTTLHMLSTMYPDAPIIMGADKNTMDIKPLLNCGLRLKQVVDIGTRNGKILDIILMNISQYYNSPVVVPPVPCDNPDNGEPSDHWVPVCYPHTDRHRPPLRRFKTVTYRPLPEENIQQFGKWITAENFEQVNCKLSLSPTHHANQLQQLLIGKLDELCPVKTMRISPQDKPFINAELKTIDRRKQREYKKKGKSAKYDKLAAEFAAKYKAAATRYIRSKVDDLKETQPGKAFGILKTMGAQPGDCADNDCAFTLPNHQELNLTDQQCAEYIAGHFAAISNEFSPLSPSLLPDRVRAKLKNKAEPPIISEYDCYLKLKATKKPGSVIPGDLPSAIVKEFMVELANPLTKLFNNITQTAIWPEHFKVEYVTPIAKIPLPQSEDDLRPIALTAFFSKVMEQFVVTWLLDFIGHRMDFRQYGGMKGNSICHYLIEFINFILYHQDSPEQVAVLACLVDFSKAFNRQDHSILITKLSDMGVPGWLLKLVIAFLSDRYMRVKYRGKVSDLYPLPGGGPQGSLLGLFLFLVLINDVGFEGQVNNAGELITSKKRVLEMNTIHLKFVDDLTMAEKINMHTQLTSAPLEERPQPDPFRARTGHKLKIEESEVLKQLKETQNYADRHNMKINFQKTKLMLFNPGYSKDFLPQFEIEGKTIDLVEQTKLLGLIVSSDLSWSANTDYMLGRCNKKLWILRRLKKLGANKEDLLDVYSKQIRSILEFAIPVWNSALTGEDISLIERIQKTALHIILGDQYRSYNSALKLSGLKKLSDRRRQICLKFAKKAQKHQKFSSWFKLNVKKTKTRQEQPKFCKIFSNTARFDKSPLSFLTELLNNHYAKKK